MRRVRPLTALCLTALAAVVAGPVAATADVQSELQAAQGQTDRLRSGIDADDAHIRRLQPRLSDLRARLGGIEAELTTQLSELSAVQGDLRTSRARLVDLKQKLIVDRRALADQLVAQYESPQLNIVTVVLRSNGFADLLETARSLQRIQRDNTDIVARVTEAKAGVASETERLLGLEAQARAQAASIISRRDQVAQVEQAILERQLVYVHAKQSKLAELRHVKAKRDRLADQLHTIQARQAGITGPIPDTSGGFAYHGGTYGFFPAPGTNYSVGDEPALAAKLDALGTSLHLHLIGLSGYRSPEHSVAVGGFPNDPHTRGEASDTPGVEGVPESTLNAFGLTRPFGGAAEADHIQLVGSI